MKGRVLVAHEAAPIREATLRVVREAGYVGIGVGDGQSARALVAMPPPLDALVVDVGLSGVLAYELCEDIHRASLPTKVILVASVYSKTAYKRRPSSLYGADDYVEQHHIPDKLVPKLARLLHEEPPPERDVHAWDDLSPQERQEIQRIRDAGEGRLAFQYRDRDEGVQRARSLARLIIADLVLYNGDEVEKGLRAGDIRSRLAADLRAARELFALRVPPEIAGDADYLGEALDEFVGSLKGGAP